LSKSRQKRHASRMQRLHVQTRLLLLEPMSLQHLANSQRIIKPYRLDVLASNSLQMYLL
jgi:hypothetical protein